MSVSFYLPHKKTLFSNKILKVKEILTLIPKLQQFSYDVKQKGFDEERLNESKLNEHTCVLLGIDLQSDRGFEISFEKDLNNKDAYRVRFYTPSTESDWKVGLRFVKALAQKLGVGITSEYGEEFSADTIESYNYAHDIMFGISSMFAPVEDSDTGERREPEETTLTLFGLYRPVCFDRALKEKLVSMPDPIKQFSDFFSDIQYTESFSANQKFYQDQKDKSIFGMYVLTQDVETIVPFKPFVEFKNINIVSPKDVKTWKLTLMYIDGDESEPNSFKVLDVVDYESFMQNLPKEKYHFIDASYIEIHGLTKDDMEYVLQKIAQN